MNNELSANTRRQTLLMGIMGLLGALITLSGDMLLYFTPLAYNPNDFMTEYARIMSGFSPLRLTLGAFAGPLGVFFYCAGFRQLRFAFSQKNEKLYWVLYAVLVFGFIFGCAFHAVVGATGIVATTGDVKSLQLLTELSATMSAVSYGLLGAGYLLLAVFILLKKTLFPRLFVLLTPAVTVFIPFALLPQPFRIVLDGGQSNIICLVFFAASTVFLDKKARQLQ